MRFFHWNPWSKALSIKKKNHEKKTCFFKILRPTPGTHGPSIYRCLSSPFSIVPARTQAPSVWHCLSAQIASFFAVRSDQKLCYFWKKKHVNKKKKTFFKFFCGSLRNFVKKKQVLQNCWISRQQKCPFWQDSHMVSLQERPANQQHKIFKKTFQRGLGRHPDLIYHILISILDAKKFCWWNHQKTPS